MQGAYSTGDTNKVQYCQEVKSILARYKNPLCAAAPRLPVASRY